MALQQHGERLPEQADQEIRVTTSSAETLEFPDPDLTVNSQTADNANHLVKTASPDIKTPRPKILYHRISKDHDGTIVENIESAQPIQQGETGVAKNLTEETVLEVLTTKNVKVDPLGKSYSLTTTQLKIYSAPLINALQEVVQYWPGTSLLRNPMIFSKPYSLLGHHIHALKCYKNNHPACHSPEFTEACNDHIDVLLDFLDKEFGDELRLERARYQKTPPTATFENLWMLFKPGQDVYIKAQENQPAIPLTVGSINCLSSESLFISGWGVNCNGREIKPQIRNAFIKPFDGEKEIFSLEVYPKEFHDKPDYEQELQKRGQRYWEFCDPAYRQYHGTTIADGGHSRIELNGRIVIDFNAYNEHWLDTDEELRFRHNDKFHYGEEISRWAQLPSPRGCECQVCGELTARIERSSPFFRRIATSMAKTKGDPHLYFLSDYVLRGYALKERKWLSFHIDYVQDLRVDESPFDNLILRDDIKTTIQSIVWSYKQPGSEVKAWSADFIQEKGEGQIFLLHGTPGVGKTCTAEIVADYMKRPLLPLTCGDMGITASEVQENITKYFELGEHWGAVILMDEADIYLEQRAPDQLERNSLVSVFLRALEYFRGILFITTNRVGTFDDAFISRIHVALYYPPLIDGDRVLIWENNFRRLEKDANIKVPNATRIYTRYDEGLRLIKWNGREIRNAFQTAVALARKEASDSNRTEVILEAKHLEAVVKLSRSFKAYIDEVHHHLDEGGRAKRSEARADNFAPDKLDLIS